ncbi:glycoside hydrolase family 3 domain protein [Companilactobacillus tucceti DSM 20183]|uniref:Glycoside hydrolase family 3 domain protein n=1 Tax=Companilactobacillus tucceti DSM 20183 TaxID=1423811 RepID=A0A0R1J4Q7_9LACO|nr:glycoside hydrolase family 3 protein [Companilactobacillus tucceti]KRK63865.1 glycoside hydrolase family 3 domain protein [Companilactobacillus tucceti DSM 20183]
MENTNSNGISNTVLSKKIAQEGMVLLQNNHHVLPLKTKTVAVYGSGAFATVKGGTGSGDVNQRTTSIVEGLENSGFTVTTKAWLNRFQRYYQAKEAEYSKDTNILSPAFSMDDPEISDFNEAPVGIYVISRSSGEGFDRKNEAGDFQLSENELSNIQRLSEYYENSVLLLNVGGIIDTSFVDSCPLLDSILLISQPGMTAGDAVTEILDGTKTPSGKLSDTWADYQKYPAINNFGVKNPEYSEGIYVGYRYFDSFQIKSRYEFGFGLSYAQFDIKTKRVSVNEKEISIKVEVRNDSEKYRGQEVVQVYISNPQSDIPTPYQVLRAFGKTKILKPHESQELDLTIKTEDLVIFDERNAAFVLTPGIYILRVGNSSRNTKVVAEMKLDRKTIIKKVEHKVCPQFDPTKLRKNKVKLQRTSGVPFFLLKSENFDQGDPIKYHDFSEVVTYTVDDKKLPGKYFNEKTITKTKVNNLKLSDVYNKKVSIETFVANLDNKELVDLVEGSLEESNDSIIGNASSLVKGAAGQTVENKKRGIPETVNADGPAGLRLDKSYNNTAWPIGTLIAQTWNTKLGQEMGSAIGEEMKRCGVTLWLAPGMNIHRDPLGGRNFEYFSEDPLLSGIMAASETKGVQSHSGLGVTIKHFLGNNQESYRNTGNSIIGEQALREIYLKNFEIAIEEEQPLAIMSSYNMVNNYFSGANFEALTNILRDEWNFEGLVMTDWFSAADPRESMHAGNDLIMPGASKDTLFAAIDDLKPKFNEDGSIATKQVLNPAEMKLDTIELWNDFIPDVDGNVLIKVKVSSDKISEKVKELFYSGSIQVLDDSHIIIQGKWKDNNDLNLGDIQKSAIHILETIMKTDKFKSLMA